VSGAERWTRVKGIFDAVVAGPIEDRATLLRDMCGDDQALQAEVESLLAADARNGSVFERPVDRDVRGRVLSAVAGVLHHQTPTLTPGERFGPYEITGLLGAGGMGLVYRSRDTTLGREVALKILSDLWLADSARCARFEREARLLASLNHPNIGSIYGVHEGEPSPGSGLAIKALVLELVEGETLADRIGLQSASRRGLPIDEVVSIASQVIEALEAAHEAGIVHRDLKPANVKITPAGRVKVLDFGLAKAMGGGSGLLGSPTITVEGTPDAALLGTAPYMSPEQARGRTVDKRTDIWAFGCVLYEMLTGSPAFAGDGVAEVLANVIKAEPDWTALPADTPAALRLCLQRCLRKDLQQRFHDIADVRLAMEGAFEQPVFATPAPSPRDVVSRQLILAVVAVVPVLIGAVAIGVSWDSETVTPTKLILGWPDGTAPQYNRYFALAPDGSQLVYVGPDGRLWARDLDELEPRGLAGTDEASAPFFSPDGQSVGFVAGQALKVLHLQGGSVRTVAASSMNVLDGDWAPDGMLYFSSSARGVWRVAATGGTLEPVSRPDLGVTHRVMDVLPGGKGALITIENESVNTSQIGLLDFDRGEVQSLFPGAQARFATSGHVLYTTADGTLHAVPFDQSRLRITGRAVPLIEKVEIGVYSGNARFALSDNGTFVYQRKSVQESEVVWVTREGTTAPLTHPWLAEFFSLSLSPDAKQLAATLTTGTRQDIWTRSLDTGALNRLTFDNNGSLNYRATWTTDGRALTFISNRSGTAGELWRQRADGSARAERLMADGPIIDEGLISPDGHWAVYRAGGSELVSRDIKAVRLDNGADTSPKALVATRSEEYSPVLSGNGRWLAYVSQESGRPEVYVRPFPETQNAVWQISRGGGQGPVWARSGQQLFYQNLRRELMAVATRGNATFEWDPPQTLFDASNYAFNPWHPIYDVTPDGEKLLMARLVGPPGGELVLILNWFHELKRELAGRR
jgi:serine/threonine protein kinase